jgi:hypothetical protein
VQIRIESTSKEQALTSTGKPYDKLLVVYTDNTGRPGKKTVLPFGTSKPVYDRLSTANQGDAFTVTVQKNGQYTEWTELARNDSFEVVKPAATFTKPGVTVGTRDFETAVERAARQKLIVRQSSLTNAIAIMTPGAKAALNVDEVINLAEHLAGWVFENKQGVAALQEMSDDIPF